MGMNCISNPCVYSCKLGRSGHDHEGNHDLTLWIYRPAGALKGFKIILHGVLEHRLVNGICDLEELDLVQGLDFLRIARRLHEAIPNRCAPSLKGCSVSLTGICTEGKSACKFWECLSRDRSCAVVKTHGESHEHCIPDCHRWGR